MKQSSRMIHENKRLRIPLLVQKMERKLFVYKQQEAKEKKDFFVFFKEISEIATEAKLKKFNVWKRTKALQHFHNDCLQEQKIAETEVNAIENLLKNGKMGEEYQCSFTLPAFVTRCEFSGLEGTGLALTKQADEGAPIECKVSGVPTRVGDVELVMRYVYDGWVEGEPILSRSFSFTILPDPKTLWQDIPSDGDIEYAKPDQAYFLLPGDKENGARSLIAASRRGRSHAHKGAPRDDHFLVTHDLDTDWYVMTVADGAGSSPFSRAGSRLACETAVSNCLRLIKSSEPLEEAMASLEKDRDNAQLQMAIRHHAYNILPKSVLEATKVIRNEATCKGREAREYATTLLMVLCKRLAGCWLILSFGVGDGAMAVLTKKDGAIACQLLGKPDEGQFSGQTCFITMNSVYADSKDLIQRIQVHVRDDFEAVLLMSDGISDARFETSAQLENAEAWQMLWQELEPFTANNDAEGLLDWLSFWSAGNHDDRTIAILY